MKYEIMIGILFMLLSSKRVTAADICSRYGISRRTAYRYIDEISTVVPVYSVHGPGGGYSLTDDYRLPATFLTDREYSAVLNALEAFGKELPGEELSSAIDKIRANSKSGRESLNLSSATLMIDSGPWGVTSEYNNKLRVMEECVAYSKTATILYRDVDGEQTQREIEPHTLVLKQGIWYVYAYCRLRGDFRLFKAGRMERIIVGEECFVRRPTDGLKHVFAYRGSDPTVERVVLEIDRSALAEAEEWLGVGCFDRDADPIVAAASLPVDSGLISKILSFGNKVRVISPEGLARRVERMAEDIARQYKK